MDVATTTTALSSVAYRHVTRPRVTKGVVLALTAFVLMLPETKAGVPSLGINIVLAIIGLWGIDRLGNRMSRTMQFRIALSVIALLAISNAICNLALPEVTLLADRDEALEFSAMNFVAGQYPYTAKLPSGNPITPLMGAVFLAMPFVIIGGSSVWQTFVWLGVAVRYLTVKGGRPLVLIAGLCFSIPIIQDIVLLNGDLPTNNLYVILTMIWLITSSSKPSSIAASVLAGFALASRFNFIFWIPSVTMFIIVARGKREALHRIGITLFVMALLIVPFYLADPAHFSPLHAISKVNMVTLPNSGVIFVVVSALVAVAVAPFATSLRRVLVCGAIAQAAPIVCVVIAATVTKEYGNIFTVLSFGMNVSVPLLLVTAMWTKKKAIGEQL